jgi:hypothetical protein
MIGESQAMNQERLVKWEPIYGLPRRLDTPSLTSDHEGGFRLILAEPCAEGRAFSVEFDKPLAFRSVNESYRLKLIESLTELPWPTFKVENSAWIEWFHDQTYGIYRDWGVEHFVVLGEDVVEVLSALEPQCTEVKRSSSFGWR